MLERDSPWRTLRGEMAPIELAGELPRPLGQIPSADFSNADNSGYLVLFEDI